MQRSYYYAHRQRRQSIDMERLGLRSRLNAFFTHSRGAVGSRTLRDMLQHSGIAIGRSKLRRLMHELWLVSRGAARHCSLSAALVQLAAVSFNSVTGWRRPSPRKSLKPCPG